MTIIHLVVKVSRVAHGHTQLVLYLAQDVTFPDAPTTLRVAALVIHQLATSTQPPQAVIAMVDAAGMDQLLPIAMALLLVRAVAMAPTTVPHQQIHQHPDQLTHRHHRLLLQHLLEGTAA